MKAATSLQALQPQINDSEKQVLSNQTETIQAGIYPPVIDYEIIRVHYGISDEIINHKALNDEIL